MKPCISLSLVVLSQFWFIEILKLLINQCLCLECIRLNIQDGLLVSPGVYGVNCGSTPTLRQFLSHDWRIAVVTLGFWGERWRGGGKASKLSADYNFGTNHSPRTREYCWGILSRDEEFFLIKINAFIKLPSPPPLTFICIYWILD